MKKYSTRLITIILTLFTLFQYTISVYASSNEPIYYYTLDAVCQTEKSENNYTYNLDVKISKINDTDDGTLIIAYYAEDEKFVSCKIYNINDYVSLNNKQTKIFEPEAFVSESPVSKIKLMVLDGLINAKPLSIHKTLLTDSSPIYDSDSNFAVLASNASLESYTIFDSEKVYTIRVMKDGSSSAELLNISPDAVIYNGTYHIYEDECAAVLKKGAVFFYTVNAYGLVDRIDIVFDGGYDFYDIQNSKATSSLRTPAPTTINTDIWDITSDINDQIQLFIAPVMTVRDASGVISEMIYFSEIVDSSVDYINTHKEYRYGLHQDANVYLYDMSDEAPTNYRAFSDGYFQGFDWQDASIDGKAYLGYTDDEMNFDGLVQHALVMVVDGIITNALLFENY